MSSLDVLKDLQDRITALERQLADTPGSDSLQPNVITVAPDGSIGETLTGKLQAQGIIFFSPGTNPPSTNSEIQWIPTGLAREAVIGASGGTTFRELFLQAEDDAGTNTGIQIFRDTSSDLNSRINLAIKNHDGTVDHSKILLAGDGTSDFAFASAAGGAPGTIYLPPFATDAVSTQATAGTLYAVRCGLPSGVQLTGITYDCPTASGTVTARLFGPTGTLLASSNAIAAAATVQALPFTAPFTIPTSGNYFLSVTFSTTSRFMGGIPLSWAATYAAYPGGNIVAPSAPSNAVFPILATY